MITVRRVLGLGILPVALAACGQTPQMAFALPWGGGYTSWGYTSASSTINGPTGVVYMPNRGYCDAARHNDLYDLTKRSSWAGSTTSPCQPLAISMGGPTQYWAFALDSLPGGFGFAFSMRETCETFRQGFTGIATPLGSACAPVAIRLLDNTRN